MSISNKTLAVAALAGLLSSTFIASGAANATEQPATAEKAGEKNACKGKASCKADAVKEKHACKGLNSCKGNSPDGKNECKGKSACATDGSM